MDKLVLADLQALAASPDYAGNTLLAASSAVLGLSAALFLSDLTLWQGMGHSLTQGEIDDIQAMIAQLENDLMTTTEDTSMYKVKVTNSGSIPVLPSTFTTLNFDTEIYDPDGMHSIITGTERINILEDGYYLFNGNVEWQVNVVGYRFVYVQKVFNSGDPTIITHRTYAAPMLGTGNCSQIVSFQDHALTGDFYRLFAYQTASLTLNIVRNDASPIWSATGI